MTGDREQGTGDKRLVTGDRGKVKGEKLPMKVWQVTYDRGQLERNFFKRSSFKSDRRLVITKIFSRKHNCKPDKHLPGFELSLKSNYCKII